MAYAEAIEVALSASRWSGWAASPRPAGDGGTQGRQDRRRFALSIGLLCSKTFDDAIFPELFEARYGLHRHEIAKMNIKGVFQVWMHDGSYHEIPLKEAHAFTREGCKSCPDFAAEHADISTGGIGAFNDWTLTIVRTERGREVFHAMVADDAVEIAQSTTTPVRSRCCAS